MTWKAWTQLHPETTVVNGSPHLRRRPHGSESHPIGHPDLSDPFLRSANLNDTRLERHEIVLGIRFPEINRAFALPEKLLTPYPNLFLVTLANRPILIARQNELAITTFDLGSTPDHSRVTLLSQCPIRFRTKDGLVWNEFGLSRDAAGRQLQLPIPASYLTEWYEWVTHSPQTQIVTNISLLPPP
jgi:hypothetical protein